jgi:serine/threonine protein phosphatase PrpC
LILAPGETLAVVSDGYLDFIPTLEEALEKVRGEQLHTVSAQALVERAVSFARAHHRPDDVTVLALRRAD